MTYLQEMREFFAGVELWALRLRYAADSHEDDCNCCLCSTFEHLSSAIDDSHVLMLEEGIRQGEVK